LNHYINSYVYGASVETSTDGINWHATSWGTNPVTADIPMGLQTTTITNTDVGSATFQVSFTLTGFTFGMFRWFIDNPTLTSSCTSSTLFTVTGGGCNTGSVDLSGSLVGTGYELFLDGVTTSDVFPGTGSSISFGIQTLPGTYTVRSIADATYCATLMTGSAIVTPTPTVTSNASGSICSGVAQNYTITSSVSGTTYTWSRAAVSGISNPAATNQTSNPIIEVLTNTTAAPVNVIYVIDPLANSCPGSIFNYTVTVNPVPVVPTIGTIVQPSCSVGTGSVTLNGLPATGNWTITRNPGAVSTNGSGASHQITGLPASGTYTFTVTNSTGCTSGVSANVVINASPVPPTPTIVQNGNHLHSDATSGNQWYNQATGLIPGATNQDYPITVNGYFYCIVTIGGCSSDTSNILHVTNAGIADIDFGNKITVYPNPAKEKLFINFDQIKEVPGKIKIINTLGQIISEITPVSTNTLCAIDVSTFKTGLYTIQIIFNNGIVNKSVIVE
jgi:hypothetical protein